MPEFIHTEPDVQVRPVIPSDAAEWQSMRRELWPEGAEEHGAEIADFFTGALMEPLAVFVALKPDRRLANE